jgi:hypothetical protein
MMPVNVQVLPSVAAAVEVKSTSITFFLFHFTFICFFCCVFLLVIVLHSRRFFVVIALTVRSYRQNASANDAPQHRLLCSFCGRDFKHASSLRVHHFKKHRTTTNLTPAAAAAAAVKMQQMSAQSSERLLQAALDLDDCANDDDDAASVLARSSSPSLSVTQAPMSRTPPLVGDGSTAAASLSNRAVIGKHAHAPASDSDFSASRGVGAGDSLDKKRRTSYQDTKNPLRLDVDRNDVLKHLSMLTCIADSVLTK